MTQPHDHSSLHPGTTSGTDTRSPQRLADAVLRFNLPAELAQLHAEPAWQHGDRDAITLVKEGDLRMTLTTLKAGSRLNRHRTEGYSAVQIVAGRLRVSADDASREIAAGDVLVMGRGVPHEVEAIEDSAFLLTIAATGALSAYPRPVTVLEAEHHAIRMVVGVMAVLAERLELGQHLPSQPLHEVVEFMRLFGDRCHHGKEEQVLFPLLERKGVPIQGCPLGVLIHEHERGRALVTELEQAAAAYAGGQVDGSERLGKSLNGLTALYPGHMWREEYLLFPMVGKVLSASEMDAVEEQFERVEAEIGAGVHERLHHLASRLQEEVAAI